MSEKEIGIRGNQRTSIQCHCPVLIINQHNEASAFKAPRSLLSASDLVLLPRRSLSFDRCPSIPIISEILITVSRLFSW